MPDETNPKTEIDGLKLVWNDEFNGTGKPDANKWNYETGFQRNHEDQWYQADNASLDGKGAPLSKVARNKSITQIIRAGSSRLEKESSVCRIYQRFHAEQVHINTVVPVRAKIPTASGSWPAIWQVGNTWEWPPGGEIDILEYYPSNGALLYMPIIAGAQTNVGAATGSLKCCLSLISLAWIKIGLPSIISGDSTGLANI